MKRLLSASIISAILAVGAFGAISANAGMPTTNASTLAAPNPPQATETPEPPETTEGADAPEAADVPGTPDTGHADDPSDANADHQFDGTE